MAIPADSENTTEQPPNGGLRELKPMETDVSRIVLIGTVLYAVAAVILLAMQSTLTHHGHGRWPWVAVSGTGLGLLGLYYLKRRDRAIARDHAAKAAAAGGAGAGAPNAEHADRNARGTAEGDAASGGGAA